MLENLDRILTMAGRVRATAYYSRDADAMEIMPDNCPVADTHRKAAEKEHARDVLSYHRGMEKWEYSRLKCTSVDQHGDRHHCPYWYGLAMPQDVTRRIDLSMLRTRVMESASGTANCFVLCVGCQRNVAPGV